MLGDTATPQPELLVPSATARAERSPVRLIAYVLDWHLADSSSFELLVAEPLAPDAEVSFRAWDGRELTAAPPARTPVVFCQIPPPPAWLRTAGARLVWIPMWDQARSYAQTWWDALPKTLRVVALSEPVRQRATAAGLPTLALRYFDDPDRTRAADWGDDRVAFYWNRTGTVGPPGLERICRALSVSRLFFRRQLDPRISKANDYLPPARLGDAEVVQVDPRSRAEYLKVTEAANIFIAPRTCEGVGVSVVEAMARGCCVLAYDAPAMNEYVRDGHNGILFRRRESRFRSAALKRLLRRAPRPVDVDQPWRRIARHDPAALGARARADHFAGRKLWVASRSRYREFVLDW